MLPPTAWQTRPAQAKSYRRTAEGIEALGLQEYFARGPESPRPPAAADNPQVLPHVAEELLPSIYRGAALGDLPPAAPAGAGRGPDHDPGLDRRPGASACPPREALAGISAPCRAAGGRDTANRWRTGPQLAGAGRRPAGRLNAGGPCRVARVPDQPAPRRVRASQSTSSARSSSGCSLGQGVPGPIENRQRGVRKIRGGAHRAGEPDGRILPPGHQQRRRLVGGRRRSRQLKCRPIRSMACA